MRAGSTLAWSARRRLTPSARAGGRRAADRVLGGPLGSITGALTDERVVALTFDDGPDGGSTPAVLDALAAHGATATFFLLVDRAEARPDLVRRLLDAGHEVGLHGLDHRPPGTIASGLVEGWLRAGRDRLEAITRCPVRLFRPPFGSQTVRSFRMARRAGLEVVVWNGHAADWEPGSAAEVAARGAAAATPGGILLLHDAYAAHPAEPQSRPPRLDRGVTAALLLCGLGERGYAATSVGGLLAGRCVRRTAWFRP